VTSQRWDRYRELLCAVPAFGTTLDVSRIDFPDSYLEEMKPKFAAAFRAMEALEGGAIANPDENRMVGHYWLRSPERAPDPAIREAIESTLKAVVEFAAEIHSGDVAPEAAPLFKNVLVIGIGGSALGPEFVSDALRSGRDRMRLFFLDNTDPDGMDRVFEDIASAEGGFEATLTVVISKSGGTKETRNGMLETAAMYIRAALDFPSHAVAVTGEGSALHKHAAADGWLRIFPMWDWVGGRTSELSAVGLLPAALQGLDVQRLLEGARLMDEATRIPDLKRNPAALLAAAWFHEAEVSGRRDMVVLPYKDRLLLFSRYLQQLVMESLGKEKDRTGRTVHQGLTVYGNKGSTDQHAYVQQLRDGLHNFFVTFIAVLKDRDGDLFHVEPGVTSGDYLHGFFLGTRDALSESGRGSITITVPDVSARTVGALIALFERTVGLYAELVDVNAYHQPGVEAGKVAAGRVIEIQRKLMAELKARRGTSPTLHELAAAIGAADEVETVFHVLEHLAADPGRGVRMVGMGAEATYGM
jgi:glucose-6-phosphate isomerase